MNFLPGWTDNPTRILKLLVGVLLIALAIVMLAQPGVVQVEKLSPIKIPTP